MLRVLSAVMILATAGATAAAQEFRIATRIYDVTNTGEDAQPQAVANSLSLFYHRKVYDIVDTDGEVIIFEPAENRFSILSTLRSLATTVDLDEIKHKLKVAEKETFEHVGRNRAIDRSYTDIADALQFHLQPSFEESFTPASKLLTLASEHVTYSVKCAKIESRVRLDRYLEYADWMARLNYLLNPHSLYPASRLELNDALRRHQMMPIEVTQVLTIRDKRRWKARHKLISGFDDHDRNLISYWEQTLNRDEIRHTTFREYQQVVLGTVASTSQ